MKRYPLNKNGYTLMEALIASAILLLCWLSLMDMMIVAKMLQSRARHKTQAVYVIQQILEETQKKPYSGIASSPATAVTLDTSGTDTTSDDFTGVRTVTVSSPSSYYKKVVVALTWSETGLFGYKSLTEYGGTYICSDPQAN